MASDTLDGALAVFLELLAVVEHPGFAWGPAELRAAFQWGDTVQRLVEQERAAPVVEARLQALRPQLSARLQELVPSVATHPLELLLEGLLARSAAAASAAAKPARSGQPSECCIEVVLACYMAAVVLRRPPGAQQAAAEHHLTAALAGLQQAAAAHGLQLAAAQQAAAAASAALQHGYAACISGSSGDSNGGLTSLLEPAEQRRLLAEALQQLTSPESLESAAVAQLLVHRAEQQGAPAVLAPAAGLADRNANNQLGQQAAVGQQQAEQQDAAGQKQAGGMLGGLLHSPPTPLELGLLCLVVLLPCWEAMLRRLAGLQHPPCVIATAGSGIAARGATTGGAAAREAAQLLCTACSSQPQALLAQHPALLAEVCRCSFRFTCAYAVLLAGEQQRAAGGTLPDAETARWRVAHAAKHSDHVTSYLLAKGCTVRRFT